MILFLLALPVVFMMNYGDSATGAVVNEVAQLRILRINEALAFPAPFGIYKTTAFRVRKFLIDGAKEDFYYPYGLGNGDLFFLNEINLLPELFILMCLQPSGIIQEGRFISPGGISIRLPDKKWFSGRIEDIGQVPCDPVLQKAAEKALNKVIELDFRLVEMTVQNSRCGNIAAPSLRLAQENLGSGEYEAVFTNLRSAGSKSRC